MAAAAAAAMHARGVCSAIHRLNVTFLNAPRTLYRGMEMAVEDPEQLSNMDQEALQQK